MEDGVTQGEAILDRKSQTEVVGRFTVDGAKKIAPFSVSIWGGRTLNMTQSKTVPKLADQICSAFGKKSGQPAAGRQVIDLSAGKDLLSKIAGCGPVPHNNLDYIHIWH